MGLSLVIPTRDRAEALGQTLQRLGEHDFGPFRGRCDLFVIDNASASPLDLPGELPNGVPVRCIRLHENRGASARNVGAHASDADWLVMLDDDSAPLPGCRWDVLERLPRDVGGVGGEILLENGQHESGGLPEVIVGCGCAVRREPFLEMGGYDDSFGYYAEEYDLCAGLILGGDRIIHTHALRFLHRKTTAGRDFNLIVQRLVRNNAWIMQRYAPEGVREREIEIVLTRYKAIAAREGALEGYERGLADLSQTLAQQVRTPLDLALWDRFTGRAHARAAIRAGLRQGQAVRLLGDPLAKGRGILEEELIAHGCVLSAEPSARGVCATLSPGPMLDLLDADPGAFAPWSLEDAPAGGH